MCTCVVIYPKREGVYEEKTEGRDISGRRCGLCVLNAACPGQYCSRPTRPFVIACRVSFRDSFSLSLYTGVDCAVGIA